MRRWSNAIFNLLRREKMAKVLNGGTVTVEFTKLEFAALMAFIGNSSDSQRQKFVSAQQSKLIETIFNDLTPE